MELRIIDYQYFIVSHAGKKETIQTPAEAKASEQKEIEETRARIGQLDAAIGAARQRLESELLDGIDTSATRAEITALGEEIHDFQRDIDEAGKRIKQVDLLIDQHAAASIQQDDQAKLEALVAPFDTILKETA